MQDRKYNVVVVVTEPSMKNHGKKYFMTENGVTHQQGCKILSSLTKYPWRLEMLEEVAGGSI